MIDFSVVEKGREYNFLRDGRISVYRVLPDRHVLWSTFERWEVKDGKVVLTDDTSWSTDAPPDVQHAYELYLAKLVTE